MDKETLDAFSWRLTKELWDELYFYVPDNEVFQSAFEKIEYFKTNKVFDTILVMDYYQGPMYYKEDRNKLKVFIKSERLKKNIYHLLEKQQTISLNAFEFVLNEYYKQAEFFLYIGKWMQENIKEHIRKGKIPEGIFYYQYATYKDHMEALVNQFYNESKEKPKTNLNTLEFINSNFIESSNLFKKPPIVNFKKNNKPKNTKRGFENSDFLGKHIQKASQKKEAYKKRPIIRSSDAEIQLLKSVFKIKFNN